jgi:hypothetical protein
MWKPYSQASPGSLPRAGSYWASSPRFEFEEGVFGFFGVRRIFRLHDSLYWVFLLPPSSFLLSSFLLPPSSFLLSFLLPSSFLLLSFLFPFSSFFFPPSSFLLHLPPLVSNSRKEVLVSLESGEYSDCTIHYTGYPFSFLFAPPSSLFPFVFLPSFLI